MGSLWETKGGKSGEGGCGSPREGYLGVVSNAVFLIKKFPLDLASTGNSYLNQ